MTRLRQENESEKTQWVYSRSQLTLNVAPSTYYKELKHTPSQRELENERIDKASLSIYTDSKKRYGAWKIHQKLTELGFDLSIKRVQKRMRIFRIHSITVKKYRPTKDSKNRVEERTNLLNQDFSTTSINPKWVADITYISTAKDGWTSLNSVIDLFPKKIIGYTYSKQMITEIMIY